MAYNVLAGGVLTGKYLDRPAAPDDQNIERARRSLEQPRGRMDTRGWGPTLYRYRSGPADEATRSYAKLAKEAGMPLTELALRWMRTRSVVTTSLLGHTSVAQLEEDLKYFKSSTALPRDLLWQIDRVHMRTTAHLRIDARWVGLGRGGRDRRTHPVKPGCWQCPHSGSPSGPDWLSGRAAVHMYTS